MSAGQVVDALAAKVPDTKPTIVYSARTDPNDLLGRPHGYASKAAFTDSRIPKSETMGTDKGDSERGGGVEVFDTERLARARAIYIDVLQQGSGGFLGNEYLYVSGATLLRVSDKLAPDEAKEYADSLGKILATPVVAAADLQR
jgi:hypothetical protein